MGKVRIGARLGLGLGFGLGCTNEWKTMERPHKDSCTNVCVCVCDLTADAVSVFILPAQEVRHRHQQ